MAPAHDILHPELLAGPRLTRNLSHRARDEGTDWGQTRQQEQIVSQGKNHRRHKSAFTQARRRRSRREIRKISIPITLLQPRHVEVCQINNSITYLAPLLLYSLVEGLANISLDPPSWKATGNVHTRTQNGVKTLRVYKCCVWWHKWGPVTAASADGAEGSMNTPRAPSPTRNFRPPPLRPLSPRLRPSISISPWAVSPRDGQPRAEPRCRPPSSLWLLQLGSFLFIAMATVSSDLLPVIIIHITDALRL